MLVRYLKKNRGQFEMHFKFFCIVLASQRKGRLAKIRSISAITPRDNTESEYGTGWDDLPIPRLFSHSYSFFVNLSEIPSNLFSAHTKHAIS